jgi:peptide/nickel transport system permease protein
VPLQFMIVKYVSVRLLTALATLVGVSVLVFAGIHAAPGSYAQVVLGPRSTAAARAHLAHEFGLDKPLPIQYLKWLAAAAHGDFGVSFTTEQPIGAEFARRAPVTIELTIIATILSLLIGVPLGVLGALHNRWRRLAAFSRASGALAMSTPDFVAGSVLVYLFTRYRLGLTVGGYVPFVDHPIANLRTMLLPGATLGIFCAALVMRTTRTAVLGVLAEPHITAAVARGEAPLAIIRRHVLRNSAIPIVTVSGTNVGYLLGGAVIVETLFSLPGVGAFTASAIQLRDFGVIEAGTLIAAAAFIGTNLTVDLSYGLLDRRVVRWRQ